MSKSSLKTQQEVQSIYEPLYLNIKTLEVLCSENSVIKNYYDELYENCERMRKSNGNWACCIKDKLVDIH